MLVQELLVVDVAELVEERQNWPNILRTQLSEDDDRKHEAESAGLREGEQQAAKRAREAPWGNQRALRLCLHATYIHLYIYI